MIDKSATPAALKPLRFLLAIILATAFTPSHSNAQEAARYEGPILDVQAHAISPKALEAAQSGILMSTTILEDTKNRIALNVLPEAADDLSGEKRLASLRGDGVQIITVNMGFPDVDPLQLLTIAERTNDWLGKRAEENNQIIPTATVAPPNALSAGETADLAKRNLEEIRKSIEEENFKAIFLSAQYDGVFLGDSAFEPIFSLAAELGVPVIIHPAVTPTGKDIIPRRNIPTYSGFLNDQRTTLLDIVMAGEETPMAQPVFM